jgi:hypothetical protein
MHTLPYISLPAPLVKKEEKYSKKNGGKLKTKLTPAKGS